MSIDTFFSYLGIGTTVLAMSAISFYWLKGKP
jgi:hypothetical protein